MSTETPTRPPRALPQRNGLDGGRNFEEREHLVSDDDPDTALCGLDQTGVPWNQTWLPKCQACIAISHGRMS